MIFSHAFFCSILQYAYDHLQAETNYCSCCTVLGNWINLPIPTHGVAMKQSKMYTVVYYPFRQLHSRGICDQDTWRFPLQWTWVVHGQVCSWWTYPNWGQLEKDMESSNKQDSGSTSLCGHEIIMFLLQIITNVTICSTIVTVLAKNIQETEMHIVPFHLTNRSM